MQLLVDHVDGQLGERPQRRQFLDVPLNSLGLELVLPAALDVKFHQLGKDRASLAGGHALDESPEGGRGLVLGQRPIPGGGQGVDAVGDQVPRRLGALGSRAHRGRMAVVGIHVVVAALTRRVFRHPSPRRGGPGRGESAAAVTPLDRPHPSLTLPIEGREPERVTP